ncbi:MAG: hypothetical protein RXR52_33645 [Paraburkholderia sp.]|uniref:hypothetical protein n=1 Tax=Paraburkholderia sp. TaxID=1926495 RepID=UPI00397E199A
MSDFPWTEKTIGRALAQKTFNRKYLVVVPNCTWTGYEADLLAVTENLRLIDVEIKISRSDLKADAAKDKWVKRTFAGYETRAVPMAGHGRTYERAVYDELRLTWPRSVWKHYYALPAAIWMDSLFDSLGSPASGVLLLSQSERGLEVKVARPAKPNRDAKPISPAAAVDLARLASLRMWESYAQLDAMQEVAA